VVPATNIHNYFNQFITLTKNRLSVAAGE